MEISSSIHKLSQYSTKKLENNLNTKKLASQDVLDEAQDVAPAHQDVLCWKCGTTDAMQNHKELPVYKRPRPVRIATEQTPIKVPIVKAEANESVDVSTTDSIPVPTEVKDLGVPITSKELHFYSRLQKYMDKHPVTKRILSAYSKWTEENGVNGEPPKEYFDKFVSSHEKAEYHAKRHHAFFDRFFSNPYYFSVFRKLEGS